VTDTHEEGYQGPETELPMPFEMDKVAERRRTAIINYVIALVALAKTIGMDPAALAAWLHLQYAEAGWYEEFLARHGPGNLVAFAEEFVSGRRLLHNRSFARLRGKQLTVQTEQFDYRSDFSACSIFGIEPEEVEQFFDAVVGLDTRQMGIDAKLTRDAQHEILVARPARIHSIDSDPPERS
jgi:hypothetical protein